MPQPIDLPTEVARTTQVERIQQIADRTSLAAQQRLAAEVDEDRVQVEQNVNETPDSNTEGLDRDGRRRTPYVARRKQRATEETPETERRPRGSDGEPHRFDVSV